MVGAVLGAVDLFMRFGYYKSMTRFKIIVAKHPDGYAAYPLGLTGVVAGEGDTYKEALTDVKSSIQFHLETFGQ